MSFTQILRPGNSDSDGIQIDDSHLHENTNEPECNEVWKTNELGHHNGCSIVFDTCEQTQMAVVFYYNPCGEMIQSKDITLTEARALWKTLLSRRYYVA
jgi:hypothetical protein